MRQGVSWGHDEAKKDSLDSQSSLDIENGCGGIK